MLKDERILIVHNEYKQRGGEEYVVESEFDLLKSKGLNVRYERVANEAIVSVKDKARAFLNVAYSKEYKQWMENKIEYYRPTIIHIHNTFPLLSPSIYDACLKYRVPIVQTIHNYRMLCPSGLLMRDQKICEKCLNHSAYRSVKHKCYKNSYIGTFGAARMVENSKKTAVWTKKIDVFIALTEFAKKKLESSGIPGDKIMVKPNFIKDDYLDKDVRRQGAIFVGRLSEEKGIQTMVEAWKECPIPLSIIGDGPQSYIRYKEGNNKICFFGGLSRKNVLMEMRKAEFLVFPSLWYEGFPLVLIEALSQGLPIISSNIGAMSEIVIDRYNGLHFEVGDARDLLDKVMTLKNDKTLLKTLQANARIDYLQKYTTDINYKAMENIYHMVGDS